MERGSGARNSGPVALPPPPGTAFMTKPAHRDVLENPGRMTCAQSAAASAVQLVCTNPGCMMETWMDVEDWEARVTSAQRWQQRGWNGDEDDWRPDHVHVGSSAAFPQQLACPCGRGFRRRATMPSTSSPAVVAARLDRLHQLRLMRRSEPMLAAGPSHLSADWSTPYQWPSTPSVACDSLWSSRPAMSQPHFGFCQRAVAAESFQHERPVVTSRQRVFSEPETYESTNPCTSNGYVYPTSTQQSQLLKPLTGYKLQLPSQRAPSSATLDFCNGNQLGSSFSNNFKPINCAEVVGQRGHIYSGQESERRSVSGLTPKRPSRSDVMSHAIPSSVNGDVASRNSRTSSSRRDGASPDSISSDTGSSVASTGSASGHRKPAATGNSASTACSRGNIFRQRTPAELATFRSLSMHCNAYEVQTSGDDAPYGKDRLRTHVLVALSSARRSTVDCVICCAQMTVYHDFPLLDGLFFESPMKYNSDVRVEPLTIGGLHRQPLSDASKFYLNAVCFKCLQVNEKVGL